MTSKELIAVYKHLREMSWGDDTPDHLATNCDEACDAMLRVIREVDLAGYLECIEHYVAAGTLPSELEADV